MNVGDKAEPQRCVGVIENQAVIFAIGRPQASSDDLDIQNFAVGRAGKDDAAHIPVDAGGQSPNVTDDLDLASVKLAAEARSLVLRCVRILVAGGNTSSFELLLQVLGMRPIHPEAERRTIFAPL